MQMKQVSDLKKCTTSKTTVYIVEKEMNLKLTGIKSKIMIQKSNYTYIWLAIMMELCITRLKKIPLISVCIQKFLKAKSTTSIKKLRKNNQFSFYVHDSCMKGKRPEIELNSLFRENNWSVSLTPPCKTITGTKKLR